MTPAEVETALVDLATVVRALARQHGGPGDTSAHSYAQVEHAYARLVELSERDTPTTVPLVEERTEWGNMTPNGPIVRSHASAVEQTNQNGWPLLSRSVTYGPWVVHPLA